MTDFHLIHHMARSGGTIIAKCIAAMAGTALLSEIHPKGMTEFHPLLQAVKWHRLVPPDEARQLAAECPGDFARSMSTILRHAKARGLRVVVRDWTHLDYTGVPYMQPSYRLTCYEALSAVGATSHAATVRHPVTQWLSLVRLPSMATTPMPPEEFLVGYLAFAREAARMGFIRYEDFTRNPDGELQALCDLIGLPFDPGYRDRWADVQTITGDTISKRAREAKIQPDATPPDPEVVAQFASVPLYTECLDLLGYA